VTTQTPLDRNGYRQPVEATGRMAGEIIYVIALAVTAGADVAAFDQVLSMILQALGQTIIWVAVAGFTAMSLTLAHFAGRMLRDHKADHGPDSKRAVWLLLIPWALLGLAALLARLIVAQGMAGAPTTVAAGNPAADTLAGAVLFLILYLASGAVAGFGEYLTRNPYRAHYRTARRAHRRSVHRMDRSAAAYERAISVWELHEQSRQDEEKHFTSARQLQEAHADELKRYAAYLIATHLKDPSVTDGMTRPDRVPGKFSAPSTSGIAQT
jgi:hypothetical protein